MTQPNASVTPMTIDCDTPDPRPNPERLQKRCPDCFGTGRVDFGDDTPMTCQLCGGEGMLP